MNNAGTPRCSSGDIRSSEVLRGGCKGYDKQATPNTNSVVRLLFDATSAATRAPIERPSNEKKCKMTALNGNIFFNFYIFYCRLGSLCLAVGVFPETAA